MIRAAVVGLGRIGCGGGIAETGTVRSHVGAIKATLGMSLAAVIDNDAIAREACAEFWSLKDDVLVAERLDDLAQGAADVISLCTPINVRAASVKAALEKQPKVLVVEKPLANSVAEATETLKLAQDAGVALRVNFHRRFDTGFVRFREAMPDIPRHVVMRYGKGLFNYASHAVDLLLHWFGPVQSVQSFSYAGSESDPHISFLCRMEAGFDAHLIAMPGLEYDQFEADFFFSDRRMELANGGTDKRLYEAVQNLRYPGYTQLAPAVEMADPAQIGGLRELYHAVHDHLAFRKKLPGCNGNEALMGLRILEAARTSAQSGGVEISLDDGLRQELRTEQ